MIRRASYIIMGLLAAALLGGCVAEQPAAPASNKSPGSSSAPASLNRASTSAQLEVVGHLNIAAGPGHISDVWARIAPSGRSYAYLGSFDRPRCGLDITGIHIVDITDPANPQKVGFIPSPAGTRANDVKVEHIHLPSFHGDILVHSVEFCPAEPAPPRERSQGIVLYDVTDPLNPVRLAADFSLGAQVHNTFIYQQGERAFVLVVQNEALRDFHIIEITEPDSPREVFAGGYRDWLAPGSQLFLGAVPIPMLHDVWAQSYPADHPNPVYAGKTIAYLSYWDAGLILLDITDPGWPVFLGDSDYLDPDPVSGLSPEGNSHAAVPTADGQLVFMGDEDFDSLRMIFTVDTGAFPGGYAAVEGQSASPLGQLAGKTLTGPAIFVGQACDAGSLPPAPPVAPGQRAIALIELGGCPLNDKIANVKAAGYGGAIFFSGVNAPRRVIPGEGDLARADIPVIFVSRFTAFAILGISPSSPPGTLLPPAGTAGAVVTARADVFDGWGYGRILDVSDPANIVEVGQYVTENVMANPPPPGDHTMHNVVIEGRTAFISWYADGIRVVDFTDPSRPVEIARFVDPAGSDFWGVYLYHHPDGNSYILGSDRSTGLWVFRRP